jgi:hypothetical protein
MTAENRFGLLRRLLRTLGLSQQSADDVVNFIVDLLAGESKSSSGAATNPEFPYHLRDHFLSPAELSFFEALQKAVNHRAVLLTKVALGDIFWVKKDEASRHRIYTNKIDRKHVDFLLCDPVTMQPLAGVELDDKSHQRPDRQERDAFVDQVFKAAGLPLIHVPVKRSYVVAELAVQLAPFLGQVESTPVTTIPAASSIKAPEPSPTPPTTNAAPQCPKCGAIMTLRTAKSGANAGSRFWGCSNYPTCRSMLPYQSDH